MSLDAQVLDYLRSGAAVTPALAAERWRIHALHSLVARLRKRGHEIECRMRRENGRHFGEYRLRREER